MIKPLINSDSCKGCGLCITFCPRDALRLSQGINSRGVHYAESANPEACNGCGICYHMCPDAAVEILEKETIQGAV